MNRTCVVIIALAATLVGGSASADAGLLKSLWKTGRGLVGKAIGEGAEASGKAVTKHAARHADDVTRIAVKNSDEVSRFVAKSFDGELADVAKGVLPENGRRLLAIADDLKASGRGAEVLLLLKEGGKADQVVAFLHRNKATIAGGAAITALLMNPEAVLGAASDVTVGFAEVAGDSIAKPLIQSVVPQLVTNMMWSVFGVLLIGSVVLCWRLRLDVRGLKPDSKSSAGVAEVKTDSKSTLLSRLRLWQLK